MFIKSAVGDMGRTKVIAREVFELRPVSISERTKPHTFLGYLSQNCVGNRAQRAKVFFRQVLISQGKAKSFFNKHDHRYDGQRIQGSNFKEIRVVLNGFSFFWFRFQKKLSDDRNYLATLHATIL